MGTYNPKYKSTSNLLRGFGGEGLKRLGSYVPMKPHVGLLRLKGINYQGRWRLYLFPVCLDIPPEKPQQEPRI